MITDVRINEDRKRLYYEKGYWGTDTLNDVWARQSAKFADRVYVKDGETTLTYGQVEQAARKVASWMVDVGVKNGDPVTFQMPKWSEFCIIYVACLKVGAVMHPLDVKFGIDNLEQALNKVKSVAYIAPTYYHKRNYEVEFHSIAENTPHVKHTMFIDKKGPVLPGDESLSHVLEAYGPLDAPCPSKSDDVACILSTSGSTGLPKQVLFTHNNILFSERSYISVLDLTPDDVMWMPSPLNHATGFYHGLISTMLFGGSTVLHNGYSPATAAELIKKQRCTWSHGATPFIFDLLHHLDETNDSLPSMRFYICGGAPVPPDMIKHAAEYGILVSESYGSTESCPHVYVPLDKVLEWQGRWSGIPYPGIEVRVVDENHNPVPAGVQGEECSRGPHQFVGYLDDPERTDRALDSDGWFYSGDLCYMDEHGRIRINGRKKEIIIRGGENISANEVDSVVRGCPGVGDHATIGVPDERLGERICMFLVPKDDIVPSVASITGWLAEQGVPKRVWPERVEIIDKIPYTATGKIQRFKLTEELLRRMKSDSPNV